MNKSKLALGLIAAILSAPSIHAVADEAQKESGASSTTVNVALDKTQAQQEVFLEHVNSVVGKAVYQDDETGVTVYAAREPAPIYTN